MSETKMNCNWAYIEGDLDEVLGYGSINWDAIGFTTSGIRWAVQNQYQICNEDEVLISLFPIENESKFYAAVGSNFNSGNPKYRVVTQEECDEIHASLIAIQAKRDKAAAMTPSEEETFQAQMLLLLTEIADRQKG